MGKLIPTEQFKIVVEYTPLVSIDLIAICQNRVLLGKRVNRLVKDFHFTTDRIVRKIEMNIR